MTTHLISWSEIQTIRQCKHKWWLEYQERWATPEPSPALQKGTLWHLVLERHYKTLRKWQQDRWAERLVNGQVWMVNGLRNQVKPLLFRDDGSQTEIQELVEWMYDGYLDQFGFDEQWEVLAVEHQAQIWLPTMKGGRSNFRTKVKLDLAIRIRHDPTRRIWLVDHKSGKDLPKNRELDLDDQFGLYVWGLRQLGQRPYGIIYNAARTQRNISEQPLDERFTRPLLYRTEGELEVIAKEAYLAAREAYRIRSLEEAPRSTNPDTCRWKCPFTEPCLASRRGLDVRELLRERGFNQDALTYIQDRDRKQEEI